MRSNLLVHWSGKDLLDLSKIGNTNDLSELDSKEVDQLVQRTWSFLEKGFRMSRCQEQIQGGKRDSAPKTRVASEPPIVCFTENRLSKTFTHAKKYGFLGFAVNRLFVLDRHGGPVQYLRNHTNEAIVASLEEIGEYLLKHANDDSESVRRADAISYLVCFYKAMSKENKDSFDFIDEHEWRLVRTEEQINRGNIKKCELSGDFYVPFTMDDCKLIVVPNDRVRSAIWTDLRIKKRFDAAKRPPNILTVEECLQL